MIFIRDAATEQLRNKSEPALELELLFSRSHTWSEIYLQLPYFRLVVTHKVPITSDLWLFSLLSLGMNAAIRGAVRCALDRGAVIYGVCEGYDGLVQVMQNQTRRL